MRRITEAFPNKLKAFQKTMADVTQILQRIEIGDVSATDELLPIVYDQLRRLASRQLGREGKVQLLQTTELVHEAYLRLVGTEQDWTNRAHFFAAAAEAMRRILVENARRKRRIKHGGEFQKIEMPVENVQSSGPSPEEIILVHDLLDRFAEKHPVEAKLVKLHYFGGLSVSEAGEMLGIPSSTAHRQWQFARSWFHKRSLK